MLSSGGTSERVAASSSRNQMPRDRDVKTRESRRARSRDMIEFENDLEMALDDTSVAKVCVHLAVVRDFSRRVLRSRKQPTKWVLLVQVKHGAIVI